MTTHADKIIAVRTSKTVYRDGNLVIKVFDADYSKADVLNEALNQARVEEMGLNTPSISKVIKLDGKWAIISEFIKGKTLQQLMDEHVERKDEYLEMFVNIQLEMHEMTAPLLSKLKDRLSQKISVSDLDATTRYELHNRLYAMPENRKLCHGDFNPSNIIITDEGKAYIVDWAHATQGNASADAARTYLLFCLAGDIDSAEKYLELLYKKNDTAKQYVKKWLPIVAASQSVKGKPNERKLLLSWVNVTDCE